jgi:integrase
MAQITFRLNTQKTNKKGESPILLDITFNNERVKISAGKSITSDEWNEKAMLTKPVKGSNKQELAAINKKLNLLEQKANNIIDHADFNDIHLSASYFKNQWNSKNPISKKGLSFVDYFNQFIEIQKPIRAYNTVKVHTTALNFVKAYCEETNQFLTLDNFDHDVFESMREYAISVKGMSNNSFATIFKRLKLFMNWALQKEYHNNTKYKFFKTPERPTEIICLYKDELFNLYDFNFENNRLERVRDVYCFGCFTGLRFSDIISLKREHIKDDEIHKVIVKTKEFMRIPLNQFALEILKKYVELASPLPKISEQKFNKYIKEACEKAGIDTPTVITKVVGKDVIQQTIPKHKLITSHTARKTFTTNSLILGMNESTVKRITGHKKDENFKKYVRLAESYLKDQINEAWKR